MTDCIFCRIVAGELPAKLLYEDDDIIAFNDISPKAPLHALIIPRKHIATVNDIQPEDASMLGRMFLVAKQLAAEAGYAESGYRLLMNCGPHANQEVYHIHLHVIGGKPLGH